jgi:hypothetical protein
MKEKLEIYYCYYSIASNYNINRRPTVVYYSRGCTAVPAETFFLVPTMMLFGTQGRSSSRTDDHTIETLLRLSIELRR